VADQVIE